MKVPALNTPVFPAYQKHFLTDWIALLFPSAKHLDLLPFSTTKNRDKWLPDARKIESDSIQFCIGHLVLFDFICFQLSCFYGLSLLVLSICYHEFVITLLSELGFTEF